MSTMAMKTTAMPSSTAYTCAAFYNAHRGHLSFHNICHSPNNGCREAHLGPSWEPAVNRPGAGARHPPPLERQPRTAHRHCLPHGGPRAVGWCVGSWAKTPCTMLRSSSSASALSLPHLLLVLFLGMGHTTSRWATGGLYGLGAALNASLTGIHLLMKWQGAWVG